MTVPDSVFGATMMLGAGGGIWALKSFIRQVAPRPAKGGAVSVDEFHSALDLTKEVLNGRYLLAKDANARFDRIESQINQIHVMIARYVDCDCDNCSRKGDSHA